MPRLRDIHLNKESGSHKKTTQPFPSHLNIVKIGCHGFLWVHQKKLQSSVFKGGGEERGARVWRGGIGKIERKKVQRPVPRRLRRGKKWVKRENQKLGGGGRGWERGSEPMAGPSLEIGGGEKGKKGKGTCIKLCLTQALVPNHPPRDHSIYPNKELLKVEKKTMKDEKNHPQ